ncbi:MAG: chromosomal replication initiation protein DnaA, partial [Sphingobium sp. 32-64-5]
MQQSARHEGDLADGVDGPALLAIWQDLRVSLRRDIGVRMFDQWLKPLSLGDYCAFSGTIELCAATEFSATFVANQFGDRLRLAWKTADIGVRNVRVIRGAGQTAVASIPVADAGDTGPVTAALAGDEPVSAMMLRAELPDEVSPLRESLNLRHVFDDFVVGDSNHLAFSAARTIGEPADPLFNPLYIHGATGQGKTHLLHAIADAYLTHFPGHTIIYMSAEKFMMEFVTAMRANDSMAFKARLRAARLLLIDDIQFIAGKGSTQEEFLHTINELAGSGARIVISADRAPHHLDAIDPRILSRLAGGLVADI